MNLFIVVGGSTSKMDYPRYWRFNVGDWQFILVPLYESFSLVFLLCPYDMSDDLLQSKQLMRTK
jgi:hypothetical protein